MANDKEPDAKSTTVLSKNNPWLRRAINQQSRSETDDLKADGVREFLVLIRGMVERVEIAEGDTILFGRYDLSNDPYKIDLTPYGAADRGVSREHAKVHMEGDKIYLTDLNSTNGTYLRGERIESNQPVELQKGNEVLFGRLAAQIMFR